MKLSKDSIKDIADNLDCGFVCYINIETKNIHSIRDIDPDEFYAITGEIQEGYEDIQNNIDKYIKIEKMSSHEGFQVMEDFTNEVTNHGIRERLIYALNNRKPFQNLMKVSDSNGLSLKTEYI